MVWVASTLHTTLQHGVSSITTADGAHLGCQQSAELTPHGRLKWTRPFRTKDEIWFLRACHLISTGLYTKWHCGSFVSLSLFCHCHPTDASYSSCTCCWCDGIKLASQDISRQLCCVGSRVMLDSKSAYFHFESSRGGVLYMCDADDFTTQLRSKQKKINSKHNSSTLGARRRRVVPARLQVMPLTSPSQLLKLELPRRLSSHSRADTNCGVFWALTSRRRCVVSTLLCTCRWTGCERHVAERSALCVERCRYLPTKGFVATDVRQTSAWSG